MSYNPKLTCRRGVFMHCRVDRYARRDKSDQSWTIDEEVDLSTGISMGYASICTCHIAVFRRLPSVTGQNLESGGRRTVICLTSFNWMLEIVAVCRLKLKDISKNRFFRAKPQYSSGE